MAAAETPSRSITPIAFMCGTTDSSCTDEMNRWTPFNST